MIIPGRYEGFGRSYFDAVGEYKFMITFENVCSNGVITEKIYNAFKANTIPIYWGNKDICKVFDKDSFINCHDFKDFDSVIECIKKYDEDDSLYESMLNKKKILKTDKKEYYEVYKNIWKTVLGI